MLLRDQLTPLALKAYLELRDAIVRRRLLPGKYLSEPQLVEELGVSRTPIRSALQALIQDGLVSTSPGRGTVVGDISIQDVRDIYELRIGMEGMAALLTAERAPESGHALLRSTILLDPSVTDSKELQTKGNLFHSAVADLSGNHRLRDLLRLLEPQLERYRIISYDVEGRGQEAQQEHLQVLSAIESRDGKLAERRMRAHLENSLRCALRSVFPTVGYAGSPTVLAESEVSQIP